MNWTIYAYWNAQEIATMVNGAVSIMNNGGFYQLVILGATLGSIAALIGYLVGKTDPVDIFRHMVVGAFIFWMLAVPRTTVQIIDRTGFVAPQIVSNVPIGIAAFGSITSSIGDWMTTSFETVFSLPNDLRMDHGGGYFAMNMINEAINSRPLNQTLQYNMGEYVRECVLYDIQSGVKNEQELVGSGTLWADLGNTNPAVLVTIKKPGALPTDPVTLATEDCQTAYTAIDAEITSETSVQRNALAAKLYGSTNNAMATAALDSALVSSYGYFLASTAADSRTIIQQNTVKNIFLQALGSSATGVSAQMAIADAQLKATNDATYAGQARISGSLIQMRNTIEVLLYAIFPIVILAVAVGGHLGLPALAIYIKVLLWIQLWAPLYAIASYLVALRTSSELTSQTTWSNLDPGSIMADSLTQAGLIDGIAYSQSVLMMVPVIAWLVIKFTEVSGAKISDSMMRAGIRDDDFRKSASGDYSMGNVSYGNVSMNNSKGYSYDMAPNTNMQGPSKMTMSDGSVLSSSGWADMSGTHNQGNSFSLRAESGVTSKIETAAKTAEMNAQKLAKSAESADAYAAGLVATAGVGSNALSQYGQSHGFGTSAEISRGQEQINQLAKQVQETTGVSHEVAARAAAEAALTTSINSGGSLAGKAIELATGVSMGASASFKTSASTSTATTNTNQNSTTNTDLDAMKKAANAAMKASQDDNFLQSSGLSYNAQTDIKGAREQSTALREQSSSEYAKSKELSDVASRANTYSLASGGDLMQSIHDTAEVRRIEELHKQGKDLEATQAALAWHERNNGVRYNASPTTTGVDNAINGMRVGRDQVKTPGGGFNQNTADLAKSNMGVAYNVQGGTNDNVNVGKKHVDYGSNNVKTATPKIN